MRRDGVVDEADLRRLRMWWFMRVFYGRINRIEFIGGLVLLGIILEGIIHLTDTFQTDIVIYIAIFAFFLFSTSLIMRRINDTGLRRSEKTGYAILLGFTFLYLILQGESPFPNEDGQPTKKLFSLRNLLLSQ